MTNMCGLCAIQSDDVTPHEYGANFTSHQDLATPNHGLCGSCKRLIRDRTSRSKSWIIENGKRTILERADWIPTLLRDKVVPFILYLTTTHQQQGFIRVMRRPNHNNSVYVLAHDRDVITTTPQIVRNLLDAANHLRCQRWTKDEMTGEPAAERYRDAAAIARWREARTHAVWPVVVGGLDPLPKREAAK